MDGWRSCSREPGGPVRSTWRGVAVAGMVTLALAGCAAAANTGRGSVLAMREMLETSGAHVPELDMLAGEVMSVDTIRAAPARTWDALVQAYTVLRLPVVRSDAINMRLGGSAVPLGRVADGPPSAWLDCGRGLGGVYADQYQVQFTVATRLIPLDSAASVLQTLVMANAKPRDVSTAAFRCTSLSTIEAKIAETVRKEVGTE